MQKEPREYLRTVWRGMGLFENPSQECNSLPLELRARATPSVVALEFGAELH